MKIKCSWCGKDLGQQGDKNTEVISHSICEPCAETMKAMASGMEKAEFIKLKNGGLAIVDKEDADLLDGFDWRATRSENSKTTYAAGIRKKPPHKGESVLMHRIIVGAEPGEEVDHKNGNGLDNRKKNLRRAAPWQNAANRPARIGTSKFKGVYRDKKSGKWLAKLQVNGKVYTSSLMENEIEAALARDNLAREKLGEFAVLNFPEK